MWLATLLELCACKIGAHYSGRLGTFSAVVLQGKRTFDTFLGNAIT